MQTSVLSTAENATHCFLAVHGTHGIGNLSYVIGSEFILYENVIFEEMLSAVPT